MVPLVWASVGDKNPLLELLSFVARHTIDKQRCLLALREHCLSRSHVVNGSWVSIHAVGTHCAPRVPVEDVFWIASCNQLFTLCVRDRCIIGVARPFMTILAVASLSSQNRQLHLLLAMVLAFVL